ncbi:acyl-CoA binding domain-containing protein 6 [Mactra antiquata]
MSNTNKINEDFELATQYVRLNSEYLESDILLQLYARYKQVKEGSCHTVKPGFFDFQGKQKWEAWKKLGNMNRSCAMREYIDLVTKRDENWKSQVCSKSQDRSTSGSTGGKQQLSLGVAVSTMMNPDDVIDDELKTIFDWCKDGNTKHVSRLLNHSDVNVDEKDEEGMVLLHWACDRGDIDMVKTLLNCGANIDIQDNDGQTGLHFAVSCEYPNIVRLLMEKGAKTSIADEDGQTVQNMLTSATSEIVEIISSYPSR